ncbi:MAG: magnesium transporter [Cytophagales bacterium]|nr:magnesium transporter [Cytophagales bacterium]
MIKNSQAEIQLEQWEELLAQRKEKELIALLEEAPTVEVAEFLAKQAPEVLVKLLSSSTKKESQGAIFADFNEELQAKLYHLISKETFAKIFSYMPSDRRADFYQKLSDKEQTKLLPYLTKKIKEDVITLSAYPPKTAGGIMSTDFATVMSDMVVKQAINKLREDSPSKKMIYYLYVVDANMQMVGFVTLKDLIMAKPEEKVASALHDNFVYADVYEDQESVAQKIEKYDLVAIPVLNEDKQLVGIVSHDDAMDVIRVEQTEDMEKFMGIVPAEEELDYLKTSSFQHFKKRVTWIVGLFVASFLSGLIIHKHKVLLEQLTVLALYVPMINDSGGNAGSQAATVVIRALSLEQITLRNWLRIILKEAKVAFLLALCLFFLAFLKVAILSSNTEIENHSLYTLAFTIALALSLQVIISTLIGSSLPLLIKCFKGDPAVAASPAITTIVDITGMLIYFTMAIVMLF